LTTYGIILVKVNYLRAYFIPWGWKRMLVEKNVGGKECWWKRMLVEIMCRKTGFFVLCVAYPAANIKNREIHKF